MTPMLALYLFFALGILTALTGMIVATGQMIGQCPGRQQARPTAIAIATGYAAIGAGGLTLIGALLTPFAGTPATALLGGLGLAALCLGLGFAHAMAVLRGLTVPRTLAD